MFGESGPNKCLFSRVWGFGVFRKTKTKKHWRVGVCGFQPFRLFYKVSEVCRELPPTVLFVLKDLAVWCEWSPTSPFVLKGFGVLREWPPIVLF